MVEWTGRMRDRLIQPHFHDPYKSSKKLPEPTVCPDCGAVYREGRWCWAPSPERAHRTLCPACARLRDRQPAGFVNLRGDFQRDHRDEILGLVRNIEAREKAEHPIERIMAIEPEDDGILVTTTEMHLARSIAEAVHHAWQGDVEYRHADDSNTIHVAWAR